MANTVKIDKFRRAVKSCQYDGEFFDYKDEDGARLEISSISLGSVKTEKALAFANLLAVALSFFLCSFFCWWFYNSGRIYFYIEQKKSCFYLYTFYTQKKMPSGSKEKSRERWKSFVPRRYT